MIRRLATRLAALVAAFVSVSVAVADAQRAPRRPRLAADADTNDARSYFMYGLERLERTPGAAVPAFYWAARLEPMSPTAWWALYMAQALGDPQRLVRVVQRDPLALRNAEVVALDSLRLRADMRDPFFHREWEATKLIAYARNAARREEWFGNSEDVGTTGIVRATERYFEESDLYSRGLLFYGQSDVRNAVLYWALAQRNREADWIMAERGRAFMELRQADSARAMYSRALDLARRSYDPAAHHLYESPAAWGYALGRLLEDRRDAAGARAAYEAVLERDPAYYPANLRLVDLLLQARDTATAVFRLSLALESGAAEYHAQVTGAALFSRLGRRDSTVAHLRRATELEPWASGGWLLYARAADAAADTATAIQAFERFLALAPRDDLGRGTVTPRLTELRAARPRD